MLPKSSKHFIQPTAEKLDCDPTVVEDVIGFYYAEIRRALVEMRGPNIQVENLGSFKVRPSTIPKLVEKYDNHIKKLDPNNFKQMKAIKSVERRRDKVLALKQIMDEEAERKRQFLEAKKNGFREKDV